MRQLNSITQDDASRRMSVNLFMVVILSVYVSVLSLCQHSPLVIGVASSSPSEGCGWS